MKSYTATGITLIARKFRGCQRVVTFFTRERGKVEAVAAGIGKPGSSLAGAVEPFTLSRLFLVTGRELDRLTQARVLEALPAITRNLSAFGYATWMAELTARATESGQPAPALFDHLWQSLQAVTRGTAGGVVAAAYALSLLESVGLAPVLDHCAICGQALPQQAWYNASAGGLVCADCRTAEEKYLPVSRGARGLLQGLRRVPLPRLDMLRSPTTATNEVLKLLRQHLAYHLGLTLKSDSFLRQVAGQDERK